MKDFRRRIVVVVTAVSVAVVTATPASAAIVTTDLGTSDGDTVSEATSVRDDGVAVGHSMAASGRRRAVLFAGSVRTLDTPGRNSAAYDINSGTSGHQWHRHCR